MLKKKAGWQFFFKFSNFFSHRTTSSNYATMSHVPETCENLVSPYYGDSC